MSVKQIHELDSLGSVSLTKTKLVVDDNQNGMWKTQSITLKTLFDTLYPIGSIFITIAAKPSIGTWELVAEGKCLWGVSENTTAGNPIGEGLPKPTSITTTVTNNGSTFSGTATGGAHTHNYVKTYGNCGIDGNGSSEGRYHNNSATTTGNGEHSHNVTGNVTLNVSASTTINTDDIYGQSEHVQPPAYSVHMYKRTA